MTIKDTPIIRSDILTMPVEELEKLISNLQERRLRAYSLYQVAQEAKAEKELSNQAEQLDKRLDQFTKKHDAVLKGLEVLEKYVVEIIALRMALGHDVKLPTN